MSHLLDWIYFLQTIEFKKAQAGDTETSMEDIDHTTGSITNTSSIRVLWRVSQYPARHRRGYYLAAQNESSKLAAVDPM